MVCFEKARSSENENYSSLSCLYYCLSPDVQVRVYSVCIYAKWT